MTVKVLTFWTDNVLTLNSFCSKCGKLGTERTCLFDNPLLNDNVPLSFDLCEECFQAAYAGHLVVIQH